MILRYYKCIKWPELRKMYRREWRFKKAIANVVKMATWDGVGLFYPLPASVCVGGERHVICDRIFSRVS